MENELLKRAWSAERNSMFMELEATVKWMDRDFKKSL